MSGLEDLIRSTQRGGGSGGLGDLLGGILGGGEARGGGALGGGSLGGNPMLRLLLPLVASFLMNGGLQKILGRLQAQGKGPQSSSWIGKGENEPIAAADIREAMDEEELDRIAEQLGVSREEAAEAVAHVLPDLVDQATPEGELPNDDELDRKFGRLHELKGTS